MYKVEGTHITMTRGDTVLKGTKRNVQSNLKCSEVYMGKLKRRYRQLKCFMYAKRKTGLINKHKCQGCPGFGDCLDCRHKIVT